jgi:hypothetical protein
MVSKGTYILHGGFLHAYEIVFYFFFLVMMGKLLCNDSGYFSGCFCVISLLFPLTSVSFSYVYVVSCPM